MIYPRRNRKVLNGTLRCYLKRWSIDETIRFVKQTYDMENTRLLTYAWLRNMMALLLAVFYFIAVKLDTDQKLRIMSGHVLKQAKRLFGIPDFKYYALGDGLAAIFTRSPGENRQRHATRERILTNRYGIHLNRSSNSTKV